MGKAEIAEFVPLWAAEGSYMGLSLSDIQFVFL